MRDFAGGPVVKTLNSQCRGPELLPGGGIRYHMMQLKSSHVATKEILSMATKDSECCN